MHISRINRTCLIAMMVLASAAIPAGSAASGAQGWHGKTSQHLSMTFYTTANGNAIEAATAGYRCRSNETVHKLGAGRRFGDKIPIKHGKFAFTFTAPSAKVVLDGTVTKRLVSGFFSITLTKPSCSSGKVTFRLT